MNTTKMERIEINLPQDIIFAMRGLEKPEGVKKKLKIALAILLFQEGSISLGKATELTEMSRVGFMEVLNEYGIPAYEYGEKSLAALRQEIERLDTFGFAESIDFREELRAGKQAIVKAEIVLVDGSV